VSCEAGTTQCGNLCINTQDDKLHCGNCVTKCAPGEACTAGKCVGGVTCAGTKLPCPDTTGALVCTDVKTDNEHCGSCAGKCMAKEQCNFGRCYHKPLVEIKWDGNFDNTGTETPNYAFVPPAGVGSITPNGRLGTKGWDAYGYIPNIKQLLQSLNKVTVSIWVYGFGAPANSFVNFWNTTAPYGGVQLGLSNQQLTICIGSKNYQYLSAGGGCDTVPGPPLNSWHNFIIRYDGNGQADGQGGPIDLFADGNRVISKANAAGEVVISPFVRNDLDLGFNPGNAYLDDLRIFDQVFPLMEQCVLVTGGTWDAAQNKCAIPQ
jgi:hypothetical protein